MIRHTFVTGVALVLAGAGCSRTADGPESVGSARARAATSLRERTAETVAIVQGEPIYGAEIEPAGVAPRDDRRLSVARARYLENAIARRLMELEARRLGISLSPAELAEVQARQPPPAELDAVLARRGESRADFERRAREARLFAKLREVAVESNLAISEAELEHEFRAHPTSYPGHPHVRLRQLFVPVPADAPAVRVEAAARALRDRAARVLAVGGLENFGEDLGVLGYEEGPGGSGEGILSDEGIREVVGRLDAGGISPVVRSASGLHVVVCTARSPRQPAGLPDVYDEVYSVVRARRMRAALDAWMAELHERYDVKVLLAGYNQTPTPQPSARDLGRRSSAR